jgi:alpha-tubulin suppressor-like RCC1 family protein
MPRCRRVHTLAHGALASAAAALAFVLSGCQDEVTSPQPAEHGPQLATAAQAALAFRQVSTGHLHSCGVTTDDRAYCWGYNGWGQLGDGTRTTQRTVPTPVAGGLRFRQVSAAVAHSCGITTENKAYCWGDNDDGELGDGTRVNRLAPVAVAATRRFRQISAGGGHTCAVDLSDLAFCWGQASAGQIGDGTTTRRLFPRRVSQGELAFSRISAGSQYTCAVTTTNRAYCWGWNSNGQLGDRTKIARTVPTAVFGGLSFRQVTAAINHTCGVTTGDVAYCWGSNFSRELGDGSDWPRKLRPAAVAGDLRFNSVIAGADFSCGLGKNRLVYCWGANGFGRLGTGDDNSYPTPRAVQGGREYINLDAGTFHACAVAASTNSAYCWGYNQYGQLGDGNGGDGVSSPSPVEVAAPS